MSRLIRIYTVCHSNVLILDSDLIWNNGSDQVQRQKSPLRKLRDEGVKSTIRSVYVYYFRERQIWPTTFSFNFSFLGIVGAVLGPVVQSVVSLTTR